MSSLEKQRKLFIMSSLAIPVFLLVCFVVFPAIDLFRMSFTNWDGLSKTSDFIMFDNYVSMFKNPDLWQSLKNNGVYFVVHLCMIPIELAFAVLLNGKLRAAKFYKTMVFLPYIIRACFVTSNRLKDKQYGLKYGRIGARELGKGKEKACSYGGGADV